MTATHNMFSALPADAADDATVGTPTGIVWHPQVDTYSLGLFCDNALEYVAPEIKKYVVQMGINFHPSCKYQFTHSALDQQRPAVDAFLRQVPRRLRRKVEEAYYEVSRERIMEEWHEYGVLDQLDAAYDAFIKRGTY